MSKLDELSLGALTEVSQPPAFAVLIFIMTATTHGLGKHADDVSHEDYAFCLKELMAGAILFSASISFSRLSALAFYARMFRLKSNPIRWWRWCFYVVTVLTTIWMVANCIFDIFQCEPVSKYWDQDIPGNCQGQLLSFVEGAISSVIIDLLILILPLPQIFKLQIPTRRKYLIAGAFVLGYA